MSEALSKTSGGGSLKSRSLWPLLTGVLIGLPVLYVASFGPVVWICRHALSQPIDPESPVIRSLSVAFAPIFWLAGNGPEPVADAIVWYAHLF